LPAKNHKSTVNDFEMVQPATMQPDIFIE